MVIVFNTEKCQRWEYFLYLALDKKNIKTIIFLIFLQNMCLILELTLQDYYSHYQQHMFFLEK